jgi:hypothetical protein
MVSKNNNKTVFATLALMLLSLSVASSIAISTPHYASAQGVTVEGGSGGNATNATMAGAAGNATNATMAGAAGNATNATMAGAAGNATNATSTGGGETADGTQIGGPLSLYGGGGGQ